MPAPSQFVYETKYNQLRHTIEIYLDNSNGDSAERKFPINPNSIVNLSIESDLSDWVTRGTLTYMYSPNANDSGIDNITGQHTDALPAHTKKVIDPAELSKKNSKGDPAQFFGYIFRNDGDDLLRIKITPKVDDSSNLKEEGTAQYAGYTVDANDKFWSLSHLFAIYDVEEIDKPVGSTGAASADIKCLKLYFYDIRYQKMNSNLIEYSTALSPVASKASLAEKDNSIPTGIAIKEIIESSITDLSLNVKQLVGSAEEWEDGGSSIFFTAPAYMSAYDCLSYVYRYHASNTKIESAGTQINDLSLLTIEKGPTPYDVGYFTLKPISWYFNQAGSSKESPGPMQIEHFFLQGYADNSDGATKRHYAPISNGESSKVDLKSGRHSLITNYRFVDMSPLTNSSVFRTRPVYSFNFAERKFNIEFENNTVKKAREFISKQYIKGVYKNNNSNLEDLFLITLDKDKRNLSLTPTYSLYGEDPILRQCDGIKKLLYTGLFHNACIHFRTLGLPSREIGRFIAIDRTEGADKTPHNDKFYGQWFIISIKHVFEGEIYYNEITAIKTHRFDKLPVEFVGTIDNNFERAR
jgi:hypothetical protein